MATITSATSGDSNVGGTWIGGIVPVVGDGVVIAAGHTVTLVTTHNWGNDTTTAITINGTLKASRAVNSKLTARGDVLVGATGTYDSGTEAEPIPSTVTHDLELNDSATMASSKWGFRTDHTVNTWAGVRFWGATKSRFTELSVQASASDTVITVTDATGWQIGDKLVIDGTVAQNSINSHVYRAITGVAGNVITLGSSVVAIKPVGTKIINLSSNVRVYGKTGNTYASFFSVRPAITHTTTDCVEIGETEFYCSSHGSDSFKLGTLCFAWSPGLAVTDIIKRVYRPIMHNIWSISGSTVTKVVAGSGQLMMLYGNQAHRYTIEEPICSSENHYCAYLYAGTNVNIQNLRCIRTSGIASTGFSQGPVGFTYNGGYVSLASNMVVGTGISIEINDMTLNGIGTLSNQIAYGKYDLNNCTFGPIGDFGAANSGIFSTGAFAPININNGTFQATGSNQIVFTRSASLFNNVAPQFSFFFKNRNNDVTLHERYTYGGKQERDNTTYSSSLSSLRLDSWYSANPNIYTSTTSASPNQVLRILGKCQYNAGYGTTYPATLTVTGLGITPVVFTCPTTGADTWFPIDLTVTNPNSYPGTFTLTYQAQSTANTESASVWFSGIAMENMVTITRHYGFQFLNQTYQTVNPYITQTTEATVGAYTGITINHSTNTITISSSHSIQEIYDYVYYDLCLNANLSEPEYFTTTDGISFTTTYNIINNSAITGSGNITTTGTYTGSGAYDPTITDSTGVFNHITVTGLVANSRVRINNATDNIELYNAVVAGTSVTIPSFWSTDKVLDVRVTNVIGTTAYLPYQTGGSLTATGANFLVSQELDTVYNTIAIDGSLVTKFTTDYPNLQIDFSTGGTVTWQELYAWFKYQEDGAQGIIYYFKGIESDDGINFKINTNIVDLYMDNTSGANVTVIGGYIYRDDGTNWVYSLTAHSIIPFYDRAYLANSDNIATSANITSAITSIKGSSNKDLTQVYDDSPDNVWAHSSRTLTDSALTESQNNHLMKLRNGGGGALIDYKSIEEGIKKGNAPLIREIENLPQNIKETIEEKVQEEKNLAENHFSSIIESKDQEIEKALEIVTALSEKTENAVKKLDETTTSIKRNSEKLLHSIETKEIEKQIHEETEMLEDQLEIQVQAEIEDLNAKYDKKIQEETAELDEAFEKQIESEIKSLESNF